MRNIKITFRFCMIFLFTITMLSQTAIAQNYENSKFGIFGAYATEYNWFQNQMDFTDTDYWNWVDGHFENLGAHWTRSNTQLIWNLIEPNLDGVYSWNTITNPDSIITNVYDSPADINWLGCIHVPNINTRNILNYPTQWQNFLKTVVERYNGDGTNDLNSIVKVKYWQIGNEAGGILNSYSSTEYAQIIALSQSAIYSVDSTAKICLVASAQASTPGTFLVNTIVELSNLGVQFDVIDIHHWGNSINYKMTALPLYRTVLNNNGYNNVEIWSCEHGTHCYQPDSVPYQTQTEQASSLLKRYVWNLNNGLDKLFWNNLMEWHGFAGLPGSIFNSMGLIGDGSYCGEPANEFNYIRKSYYSYKTLAENIDTDKAVFIGNNSFHNNLSGNYGYLYQELNTNNDFEIFWTDNDFASYNITLASDYELIDMVPSDTSGYFTTQTLFAGNHNLTIYKNEVFLLKKANVTSLIENQNKFNNIFPNPSKGIFTINNTSQFNRIQIINVTGKIIYINEIQEESKIDIDLSEQPNGMYFVNLQMKNNGNVVFKMVINK